MRPVCVCALLAVIASAASAESPAAANLTVILEFQGPRSDRSVAEMKREVEAQLASRVAIDWRLRGDLDSAPIENLVVVRFKGKCRLEPVGYLYDERGPLAFTYSSAGDVQPYSEVECDKVARSARSAMSGGDFARADTLFGRALGRVVAHEMIHMLQKSGAHARTGVSRPALSGKTLIAPGVE